MESYAVSKIDRIIKSHSGIGVKVLKLQLFACPNISAAVLDKWFVTVIKPGIEELSLEMSSLKKRTEYNFPCSVLSNKAEGGTNSVTFPLLLCFSSYGDSWLQHKLDKLASM